MTGSALACALLLFASPGTAAEPGRPQSGLPRAALTFPDGKTIQVDVAASPYQREIGLMHRRSLPRDYGMLFVFPYEQSLQFWMKNTLVDLDMVFLDRERTVTSVHAGVPRSRPDTPEPQLARRSGYGQFVLELPAGAAARHKLEKGRRLDFSVPVPLL